MLQSEPIDSDRIKERAVSDSSSNHSSGSGFINACVLCFAFMVVTSDVFTDLTLRKINNTIKDEKITPYGAIVQGCMLVVIYVLLEKLI